jgi:hypothetical protein
MREVLGVAAAVVAFGGAPRHADACSCALPTVTLSPADAKTAVPLNAIMIARFDYANLPSLELRNAATQELVPLTVGTRRPNNYVYGITLLATPTAPLAPNTAFVLVARDESRSTMSTFTTGDTVDTTPPTFAGLGAISFETMTYPIADPDGRLCSSSCISPGGGHISRIRLDYVPPSDSVHVVLQVRRADETSYEELPLVDGTQYVGYEDCAPRSPRLDPGSDYCARVVAYDIAGNMAGAETEVCTAAVTCAPRGEQGPVGICEPSDECVPMSAEPESSGCATTRAPTWLVLIACAMLVPRRRRQPQQQP